MQLTKLFKAVLTLLFCFTILSCNYKRKIIYFQGESKSSELNKYYNPVIHVDDILSITVGCLDLEAAKPFNLPNQQSNGAMNGYTAGAPSPNGYLVDKDGNIEFPIIGKLKVAGISRTEISEMISQKLKSYLKDPVIVIRILNFKVTVLGEVKNPGTFTIPNERITLLEAIGIAGDLEITGVRKNVLVIREEEGKKTQYRVDLTTNGVFNSPVYYLNQNDVVYVEPNRSRANSAIVNTANVGILLSFASFIFTIVVLITK